MCFASPVPNLNSNGDPQLEVFMKAKQYGRLAGALMVGAAALSAAAYATCAGVTWFRYGRTKREVNGEDVDSLLELYIPEYEVVERHHIAVFAPAVTTFAAACKSELSQSVIVSTLFKVRELAHMCSTRRTTSAVEDGTVADNKSQPKELVSQLKEIGWAVLAEIPGHEIVFGAVTQPWITKPLFRPVPPDEFAKFHEPGYVKIAWTLRADPTGPHDSIARTETRASTTDTYARARFRRYWSLVWPGVVLIRKVLLRAIKAEAERRARATQPEYETAEFGQYVG
jgi:hypothetical protein